jgi:hypothetical protein
MLTPDEVAVENLDPEEEKALASRLVAQREAIVQDHLLKESVKGSKAKAESTTGETPSPTKPKGKRGAKANAKAGPSTPLKRKAQEAVKEEEPDEIYLKKLQLDDDDDVDSMLFFGACVLLIYATTSKRPSSSYLSPGAAFAITRTVSTAITALPRRATGTVLSPLLAVQTQQPSKDNAAT